MDELHNHDPKELCKEINKILDKFPSYENYAKMSTTPLSAIATSNSALTITSLLLVLNSENRFVMILSGIDLLLLLFTSSISIYFLITIIRANFRVSRVQYRVKSKNYHEKRDFDNNEHKDLIFLTHLARRGLNTINSVEKFYQSILWRYFFLFIIISFLLLSSSILIEISVRL